MALQYELFYLVGETKESALPAIKKEVEKMVTAVGGTMAGDEMEERRKLAYPIGKEVRGVYVTKRFSLPDADERGEGDSVDAVATLTRQLHLYRDMLRFIIVRAEGLPPLGERENVPQLPRRSDSRRRDTRNDRPTFQGSRPPVRPAEEKPAPERKPEEVPVEEPAKQPESTEEAKPGAPAEQPAKEEQPAAPASDAKKSGKPEPDQEEAIDKKLDEILDI